MNTYNEIRNLNYKVRNLNQAFKCLRDYVKNNPGGEVYTEANLLLNSDYGSGYVYQSDFNQGVVDALDEAVKTVNGVEPDDSGDVTLDIPEVTAQTLFNDKTNIIDSATIYNSSSNVYFREHVVNDEETDNWGKTFYIVNGVPMSGVNYNDVWYYPIIIGNGALTEVNNNNIAHVGSSTVAIGMNSLRHFNPTTESFHNTSIGQGSLRYLINGGRNTAIGSLALGQLINGDRNIAIGASALANITTANNNTVIGAINKAGLNNVEELTNNIIIGYGFNEIGFRVDGNTGLTTVPKQTLTSYNDDSTGKAIVTKEVLDNKIANIDIPEVVTPIIKDDNDNLITEYVRDNPDKFDISGQRNIILSTRTIDTINVTGYDNFLHGESHSISGSLSAAFGANNIVGGSYSAAFGGNNTVGGTSSAAFGNNNIVGGNYSAAFGFINTVEGDYSTAFGANNIVGEDYSTAFGVNNSVGGHASVAFGSFNKAYSIDNGDDIPDDLRFSIGIGDSAERMNALSIFKNGEAWFDELTVDKIDNSKSNKVAITKEYLDLRVPTPPETGCYTLQSNDGIVSWIPCTE